MSEQEKAEQLKKQLYYDPNTCPDMDEAGCLYPDCENCEVHLDDEEWDGDPDSCEDCSLLEVEEDNHGLRYLVCHKKEDEQK